TPHLTRRPWRSRNGRGSLGFVHSPVCDTPHPIPSPLALPQGERGTRGPLWLGAAHEATKRGSSRQLLPLTHTNGPRRRSELEEEVHRGGEQRLPVALRAERLMLGEVAARLGANPQPLHRVIIHADGRLGEFPRHADSAAFRVVEEPAADLG